MLKTNDTTTIINKETCELRVPLFLFSYLLYHWLPHISLSRRPPNRVSNSYRIRNEFGDSVDNLCYVGLGVIIVFVLLNDK